jgi:hypothetical protein
LRRFTVQAPAEFANVVRRPYQAGQPDKPRGIVFFWTLVTASGNPLRHGATTSFRISP